MTTSTEGCLNSLKWWWHTSKQVVIRRHIQIISKWCRRLRRRKWWNHPATHPQPVQISPRWQASFLCRSSKAVNHQDPFCMGGTPGGREHWQGGMHWQWRLRWHWRCNWRVHCNFARAVKDAQQEEKYCYHCGSPDHFICNCPLVAASRTDLHLNWKEGMVPKKGAQAPQGKATLLKVPQEGHPRHKMPNTDSLLESHSF